MGEQEGRWWLAKQGGIRRKKMRKKKWGTGGENGGGLIFLLGLPVKITMILSYSPISKDSISFSVGQRA